MAPSKKARRSTVAAPGVSPSPVPQTRTSTRLPPLPAIPLAAVLSFIKETRGALDWNLQDMMASLNIRERQAHQIASILQLQGYVKPALDAGRWLTTPAGEEVSGSKPPRFKLARVNEALSLLTERIESVNRDRQARFQVSDAVAYGDFLLGHPTAQAAEVGVCVVAGKGQPEERGSSRETLAFLKSLRNKSSVLQLHPYQSWMVERSHRRLV